MSKLMLILGAVAVGGAAAYVLPREPAPVRTLAAAPVEPVAFQAPEQAPPIAMQQGPGQLCGPPLISPAMAAAGWEINGYGDLTRETGAAPVYGWWVWKPNPLGNPLRPLEGRIREFIPCP